MYVKKKISVESRDDPKIQRPTRIYGTYLEYCFWCLHQSSLSHFIFSLKYVHFSLAPSLSLFVSRPLLRASDTLTRALEKVERRNRQDDLQKPCRKKRRKMLIMKSRRRHNTIAPWQLRWIWFACLNYCLQHFRNHLRQLVDLFRMREHLCCCFDLIIVSLVSFIKMCVFIHSKRNEYFMTVLAELMTEKYIYKFDTEIFHLIFFFHALF